MYWALMKREALLTIKAKLELAIYIFLLFCREIIESVWKGDENFEVLTRNISKYIYIFAVSWKRSSTFVKFRVEKCEVVIKEVAEHNLVSDIKLDIPKFNTALLHSNWNNLRRKYLSQIPTDNKRVELWAKSIKISWISDAISPAERPQKSSQYVRACAAGVGAICSKNRKVVPYHGASPNTRNDARLRSPSPIMVPVTTLQGFCVALTFVLTLQPGSSKCIVCCWV